MFINQILPWSCLTKTFSLKLQTNLILAVSLQSLITSSPETLYSGLVQTLSLQFTSILKKERKISSILNLTLGHLINAWSYSFTTIRKALIGWVDMKKTRSSEFFVLVKDFCLARRDVGDQRHEHTDRQINAS